MKEIYKDVVGYENMYQVSNLGNVKSLARKCSRGSRLKERMLKPAPNKSGYLIVALCKDGKVKLRTIHQLVAIAFLNHTPSGHNIVINHKDFNKLNNAITNLERVTNRENSNRKHLKSSSEYTGVGWSKQCNKWMSRIQINGENTYLGLFHDELEASAYYETALTLLDQYINPKQFRNLINTNI
jgi:hypothetical protein